MQTKEVSHHLPLGGGVKPPTNDTDCSRHAEKSGCYFYAYRNGLGRRTGWGRKDRNERFEKREKIPGKSTVFWT